MSLLKKRAIIDDNDDGDYNDDDYTKVSRMSPRLTISSSRSRGGRFLRSRSNDGESPRTRTTATQVRSSREKYANESLTSRRVYLTHFCALIDVITTSLPKLTKPVNLVSFGNLFSVGVPFLNGFSKVPDNRGFSDRPYLNFHRKLAAATCPRPRELLPRASAPRAKRLSLEDEYKDYCGGCDIHEPKDLDDTSSFGVTRCNVDPRRAGRAPHRPRNRACLSRRGWKSSRRGR
ncbi:hypothetical protein PUN28_015875 [Cardiocondyla obscurior]|uniref:Uncharacterized protein n=1 Tax=Cardiocondyla obscurior TaxID=286306 RepID=A0AAW2ERH1_9HYME